MTLFKFLSLRRLTRQNTFSAAPYVPLQDTQMFLPKDHNYIKCAGATGEVLSNVMSVCTGEEPTHFIARVIQLMVTFSAKPLLDREHQH
jgi:hypothetical protein